MDKKTLVLGVSHNPKRHSFRTVAALADEGFPVVAVGWAQGMIENVRVLTGMPHFDGIHTITIYIGGEKQKPFYDYILGLNPKRIIFNRKTENAELYELADARGIEVVEGCTLAMIAKGEF